MIQVALVDDHDIVAQGFRHLINMSDNHMVSALFNSYQQTLENLQRQPIDVIIVDIALQDVSGIELMRAITHQQPNIRIVALSMYDKEPYISEALKAGANAYLSKRAATDDILKAIDAVMNDDFYLSDDVKQNYERFQQDDKRELSEREICVLRLLAQGFETKEVAFQLDMAEKTAHSHKANIYLKLGVRSRKKLLQYALVKNYISVDDILQD